MRASIQTKLLAMCILLVLLTTVAISETYYLLNESPDYQVFFDYGWSATLYVDLLLKSHLLKPKWAITC